MSGELLAEVWLGQRRVGALLDQAGRRIFEYDPDWRRTGFSIAPLHLPLRGGTFEFPALLRSETFQGLPGGIADSLPDRFGNAVIDAYYLQRGIRVGDVSPVEKLLYIGDRAMGALCYRPARDAVPRRGRRPLELRRLVDQARRVINGDLEAEMPEIMAVASSAGGMRAKALVWWNPASNAVHAYGADAPDGSEPWLLKFDTDREGRPTPYGRLEYAYALMAGAAGIDIAPCRLIGERDRAHFATRRFDIDANGRRLHRISLCGLMHADFNLPGAGWSYDLLMRALRLLAAPLDRRPQLFRRIAFNIVARNQDDHTKNHEFLCDPDTGHWDIAPAFDLTYAHGEGWTREHQMWLQGKADGFTRQDLLDFARTHGVQDGAPILDEVVAAVAGFPRFAKDAGLAADTVAMVAAEHRLGLGR